MKTNTVVAIGLVLAFTFGVILLWSHYDPQSLFGYPPNVYENSQKTSGTANSDGLYPVYKLIGRMDFLQSRPAAVSYVFERGGSYEYVTAQNVHILSNDGLKTTGYFVKVADGTFYSLKEMPSGN